MDVAIRTMRAETKHMIGNPLMEKAGLNIAYIIDIKETLWDTCYEGIPIISPFKAVKLFQEGKFEKIILPGATVNREILDGYYEEAIGMGFPSESIWFSPAKLFYK